MLFSAHAVAWARGGRGFADVNRWETFFRMPAKIYDLKRGEGGRIVGRSSTVLKAVG